MNSTKILDIKTNQHVSTINIDEWENLFLKIPHFLQK